MLHRRTSSERLFVAVLEDSFVRLLYMKGTSIKCVINSSTSTRSRKASERMTSLQKVLLVQPASFGQDTGEPCAVDCQGSQARSVNVHDKKRRSFKVAEGPHNNQPENRSAGAAGE